MFVGIYNITSSVGKSILTSFLQTILFGLGFELTEHSKYTSSPSLMLEAFKLLPSLKDAVGLSVKKTQKTSFYY